MNKVITVAAFMIVGGIGYFIGFSHSHHSQNHEEQTILASQAESKLNDPHNDKFISGDNSDDLDQGLSNGPHSNHRLVSEFMRKPNSTHSAGRFERLFADNSSYFDGEYAEIAVKDEKYPNAIERLTNENGISRWGISREQATSKLLQTHRLKNIHIESYECRTQTCLIRGTASSYEEAYQIFEDYQNVQKWGLHFGGHNGRSGRYVFYLASFRQEN